MLASDLYKRLAPFSALVNRKALSINYRSLFVSDSIVRGCSAFGSMEVEVDLALGKDINIDGDEFLQLLRSLPDEELELSVEDNVLHWKCDRARGQLAVLGEKVEIPELPDSLQPEDAAGENFRNALAIGSLASGTTALISAGLYGIVLDNADQLMVYASNNTTVSTACLGEHLNGSVAKAALSPDAVALLLAVVDSDAVIAFDDNLFYCNTETTRVVLKQVPPLKHDLRKLSSKFIGEGAVSAPLDRDIVATFIRRAEALSDDKGKAVVAISVEKGNAKLAFQSGKSSSEEFYLVEGGNDVTVAPILVDARHLAKALTHSTHLIFDYGNQGVLVLQGDNDFHFVISGRKPKVT